MPSITVGEHMGCLYKLTGPTGKSYIGITAGALAARWWKHKNNAKHGRGSERGNECPSLYNAMRKYGPDGFSALELACSESLEELKELERRAIIEHKTRSPFGYNVTSGGEGALGHTPTEETRRKMSDAQKNRRQDPEQRRLLALSLAKARDAASAKWKNMTGEERKAACERHGSAVRRGYANQDARDRSSIAHKATWARPGYREKMAVAMKGTKRQPWSQERKDKAADARRREWANPVMRAKRLAGFSEARERRRGSHGA